MSQANYVPDDSRRAALLAWRDGTCSVCSEVISTGDKVWRYGSGMICPECYKVLVP